MSERQLDYFRGLLTDWKKSILSAAEGTLQSLQSGPLREPDPNDRATQESEFSMELRTRDRERKLIRKIEEASRRIETNDYGYCDSCGVEIGIRRLEARPTATLCIECKELDEIRERQMRT